MRQVFRITRSRTKRDRESGLVSTSTEVVYGITTLSRQQADAQKLPELNRGHWGIENKLHWVRDETFGEDKCRIRTNHGPQQLAIARNAALALCRVNKYHQIAAARREFGWESSRLFAILGIINN